MALSLGMFTGFVTGETATFLKPTVSPLYIKLSIPPFGNLRPARAATFAASSNPSKETKKSPLSPRGIMKPRLVSPEMQAFLGGVTEAPRTQVVKQVWAHIKQNNLQDPADKKVILCDDQLKKLFGGRDQVGFLEIARLITPHFL